MGLQKYIIRLNEDAHGEKVGRCIGISAKAAEKMIAQGKATLVSKTYSLGALIDANGQKVSSAKASKLEVAAPDAK